MKKFLFRLSLFGILFGLFCLGNYLFNEYIIKHHSGHLANIETLIIGDSQMEHGINPAFFPKSANVSNAGEPYLTTFHKLVFLLERNAEIKNVFIGLSPHNLTIHNDFKFIDNNWSKNQFEISYPFLDLKKIAPLPVDTKRYWQTQFRYIFLIPRLSHEKYIGHFVAYPSSDLKKLVVQQRLNVHYYKNNELSNISNISLQMLDAMVNLCKSKNIKPVFIATPLHLAYRQGIPEKFNKLWQEKMAKLKNQGMTVLDFSALNLGNEFYRDYNHLNGKGADVLSAAIAEELSK